MFVILVYDTLAERNPQVLRTCRRYLHWVQRSVFQGELSTAQYRLLTTALRAKIDPSYDSIRVYTTRSPHDIETHTIGTDLGNTDPIV
jgi:CRISPR-associated protein Cas2